jgi:hypothetical protein
MTGLTDEERLERIEQRKKKLKEDERKIKARISAKKRKARTRELIQYGAIFTNVFNLELNEEERERTSRFLDHRYEDGSTLRDRLREHYEHEINQLQ